MLILLCLFIQEIPLAELQHLHRPVLFALLHDTPIRLQLESSGLNQVLLEEDLAHLLGWYAALQVIEDILAARVRDYVGGLLKPLQLLGRRLIRGLLCC